MTLFRHLCLQRGGIACTTKERSCVELIRHLSYWTSLQTRDYHTSSTTTTTPPLVRNQPNNGIAGLPPLTSERATGRRHTIFRQWPRKPKPCNWTLFASKKPRSRVNDTRKQLAISTFSLRKRLPGIEEEWPFLSVVRGTDSHTDGELRIQPSTRPMLWLSQWSRVKHVAV